MLAPVDCPYRDVLPAARLEFDLIYHSFSTQIGQLDIVPGQEQRFILGSVGKILCARGRGTSLASQRPLKEDVVLKAKRFLPMQTIRFVIRSVGFYRKAMLIELIDQKI